MPVISSFAESVECPSSAGFRISSWLDTVAIDRIAIDCGSSTHEIAIDDVNGTFTITANAVDDVLSSNDLEIRIDLRQSEYGVFGWRQCSECKEGTYSITPTAD